MFAKHLILFLRSPNAEVKEDALDSSTLLFGRSLHDDRIIMIQ